MMNEPLIIPLVATVLDDVSDLSQYSIEAAQSEQWRVQPHPKAQEKTFFLNRSSLEASQGKGRG